MTLLQAVQLRVSEAPDKRLFTFLADGEEVGGQISYAELDRRARAVARQIASETVIGDRVLLLYEPGLDYVVAFFACLYSGRIAVPVYPPNPRRLETTLPRLTHIIQDARPRAVATTSTIRGLAEGLLESMGFGGLAWCATDEASDGDELESLADVDPDAVAFLQYTSGSTAKPRGVRVTHNNLLANVELIGEALRADTDTVGVSWLPLYHDMGLIGKIITPAVIGCSAILMSPLDYLRRPFRWLSAISRFGGTVSAAPNFAYDLCVRKVTDAELAELDLSSWDVALNGAEPVLSETLDAFARRFEVAGFRREAFLPAYGLAESTLLVTGAKSGPRAFDVTNTSLERGRIELASREVGDADRRTVISSGSVPGVGHHIRIVEPDRLVALDDGSVGEIWVTGPSIAGGYYGRPELSAATFGARLAQDDGHQYLRTGDLGFQLGNELIVTGRRKDLMILRGRNIYPQDVEATVSRAHDAVRPGGVAAFSVERPGGEVAVVVVEVERRTKSGRAGDDRRRTETLPDHEVLEAPRVEDVGDAIRIAILAEHHFDAAHVVLIKPGSVPKTSSGKIQRHECRRQFLADELDEFGRVSDDAPLGDVPLEEPFVSLEDLSIVPREERIELLTTYLTDLVAFIVGRSREQIVGRPLMSTGLDSLKAMELQYTIEERLGVRLFPSLLLGGGTIADVASELAEADFAPFGHSEGLSDVSSEVFTEPHEGIFSETLKFDLGRSGDGAARVGGMSFTEDPHPGPLNTLEFSVEDERDAELSWNEKGFWLYQKAYPSSWAPNLYYAGELPEGTSFGELKVAATSVLYRHDNLRSRFLTEDGQPVKAFDDECVPEVETIDARGWSPDELIEDFQRLAGRPFDLENGPIIRFAYYARDSRPVLYMAMHHIVADFWSLERLIREIGDEVGGEPIEEPRVTYSDFVNWQRKLLDSDRGRWCEDFWREQIDAGVPKLRVPVSVPPGRNKVGYGRPYRASLDLSLVKAVDALAAERNTTRYTVLLAAYQTMLHRWSGQSEFFVGAVAAGRTRRFFRDVLGMFANPLPLRAKFSARTTFSEHLTATQSGLLRAMDAQEYPLQAMLERFELRRDGVDNPIVQTLFASEQPREGGLEIGGSVAGLRTLDLGLAGTVFDFTVMVYQGTDAGEIRLQYNEAKYDERAVARMAEGFREILRAIVKNPDVAVGNVPIIARENRDTVVNEWARGRELETEQLAIHSLFEQRVAAEPQNVAIDFEGGSWTYAELNRRANRLAHRLIEHGVRPGTPVGVELERSPELIAALYGVLKAGGAYVSLQPSLPVKRLEYMAENAGVEIVVTDDRERNALGGLRIGVEALTDEKFPDGNTGVEVDREDLAYLLYTSGTTGVPKGVMLPHRAVTNLVQVIRDQYSVDSADAILQKTPYSFDISVSEIFNPLSAGARLVMTRSGASRDPGYLRDLIVEKGVTVLRMTPTELATLLEVEGIETCGRIVRRVLSCGEALTPAVCRKFYEKWSEVELINLWGPTEACVYASWWTASPDQLDTIPIGKPLPNYRLYALDDSLEPLPIDLQGELLAAGPSLARGYHQMPRRTALSYLPDPYSAERGARMYRSGDLVSWNEDGELEFFGRKDSQVQLRGMRIELGELEAVLEQHPGVKHAAVRALEASDGRVEALAAYLVFAEGTEVGARELRSHLAEQVEESKIPGHFVELAEMPLTPSGKIDRKALPDPDQRMRDSERTAPTTPAEIRLAGLWRKHLKVDDIGVDENFFEIGGHSLLAVRIQHDIMKTFGLDIPLGMLFENPTIGELAGRLTGAEAFEFAPIERQDYGDEAPLSSGQRLMWIQQFIEGDAATYHSPGVFALRGNVDREALQRALTRLVERHEILRTIYPLRGDEPYQKILPPPDSVKVEFEDLRGEDSPDVEAKSLVAEYVAEPFDLTAETSFRVLLCQVREREWVLCLLFHHIAFDEWSVDVLFEEIEALYRMERGEESGDAEEALVEDWKQTYQVAYRNLQRQLESGEIAEPTFNTDGWLSSYTGVKYEDDAMREWLQGSLERLRGLKLGRTLEIGCGTGMILFELSPHATEYYGVDFSQAALAYIDAVRDRLDQDLSHVNLVHSRADEVGEIEGEFDTIIINSVAQYFPNHEYLEIVIRAACAKLRPGGRFYLGDLRDARTGYAFHASVAMERATPETTRAQLRERTIDRLYNDDELLISPQYLVQIAKGLPNISHVDFNYQRAVHATEMSLFRFCATLHARGHEPYMVPDKVLHWNRDALELEGIQEQLKGTDGSLMILGVPNRRLERFARLEKWVHEPGDDVPFREFDASSERGVEPDLLRQIGEPEGFRVTVSPSNDALGVRFDVLFERDDAELSQVRPLSPLTAQATPIPVPAVPSDFGEDLAGAGDLWAAMLRQEMIRNYSRGEAAAEGPVELAEPALQYADFAIWQQEQFEGADYARGISYWKEHLAGSKPEMAWPIGREPQRSRPAGYVQYSWGEATSAAVARFAQNHGTSEFVVLYAAFSAFLSQFCSQPDLTVGVGTTLRQRPEFRDLLGYMLNMLPLRTNQPLDTSFQQWFQSARASWEASQPHQWIPVERIVDAAGRERGSTGLSLYDVMMAYVPRNHLRRSSAVTDDFVRDMAGLQVRPFDYGGVPDALCSLFVSIFKDGGNIGTELEYDTGRFDRWQMEQLAQRFEWSVEQALKAPVRPLNRVMASGIEAPSKMLGDWNRGPRFVPDVTPIHSQFERRAAEAPERVALRFDDGSWSYGELDKRANRLARHLVGQGVLPGTRVGVTVERSPELIVALLAVMKAGAAYVAMEPDLPENRLAHIASDARANFVVVDAAGRQALPSDGQWTLVDVTTAGEAEADAALEVTVDGDDLVYMLYTSGSTGQPKGVMVPHRAVANHVGWLAEGYGCNADDVFLLKSAYGFDMSVSELFGPLCLGGTMAIAKPDGHRDPRYLVDAVVKFGVTCLRVVPTTLNLLLTEPNATQMGETLRWVSLGGEALSKTVRDNFFDTFETVELHNPYGITETCVDVTFWACPRERRGQEVSLGRPMGNYDAYTLDEWLEPVPRDKVGEIFVGGAGVSHGYWGMPRRTALIFVPDPYGERGGGRMYASGDLGRYDARGELRYQGRKDDQIQLHGIRIELGEVEAYLESAPGVLQAAVRTVNESEGRAEGLIGYLVAREGTVPDIGQIRSYLERHLRKAVIPTRFVVLDEMPRRPSGKIDRDGLPDPDQALVVGAKAKGDTEQKLVRIWTEVLGIDQIGRDANFFEVGGTSLKAIKVFRLLEQEFDVNFEVVELFAYPTIGQLAAFLDGTGGSERQEAVEEQRKRGRRRRESAQLPAARRAKKDR